MKRKCTKQVVFIKISDVTHYLEATQSMQGTLWNEVNKRVTHSVASVGWACSMPERFLAFLPSLSSTLPICPNQLLSQSLLPPPLRCCVFHIFVSSTVPVNIASIEHQYEKEIIVDSFHLHCPIPQQSSPWAAPPGLWHSRILPCRNPWYCRSTPPHPFLPP